MLALREGLSNREIAQRLYLSPRTVEKHVQSLFRKFGVSSRGRLAIIARDSAESGLGGEESALGGDPEPRDESAATRVPRIP